MTPHEVLPSKRDTEGDVIIPADGSSARCRTTQLLRPVVHIGPFGRAIELSTAWEYLRNDEFISRARQEVVEGRVVPVIGGISLFSKLGQGGMGVVYYGIHRGYAREVAVKVLPFHLQNADPLSVKRFFREARIASTINSEHLVRVSDIAQECGLTYFVMDYIHGKSAGDILCLVRKGGAPGLDEATALDICIAATKGIAAAHEQNVIHRDVKPDNILVPRCRKNNAFIFGDSKLSDLGLARAGDSTSTLTGGSGFLGTPGYMAPEQISNARTAGKQADVFGLGTTLYALLTGLSPFIRDTTMDTLKATVEAAHHSLRFNGGVSKPTAELIDICLAKNPEHRYSDGEALLRALTACRALLTDPQAVDYELVSHPRVEREKSTFACSLVSPKAETVTQIRSNAPRHAGFRAGALFALGVLVAGLAYLFTAPLQHRTHASSAVTPEVLDRIDGDIAPASIGVHPDYQKKIRELQEISVQPPPAPAAKFSEQEIEHRVVPIQISSNVSQTEATQEPVAQAVKTVEEGLPKERTLDLGGGTKLELILVPAGKFRMGSAVWTTGSGAEREHDVEITRPFYIAKYPTMLAQFRRFVEATQYVTEAEQSGRQVRGVATIRDKQRLYVAGVDWKNTGFAQSETHPVVALSWNDSRQFCEWLSIKCAAEVSLPTEAQWEYAARGFEARHWPWGGSWSPERCNHADAGLKHSTFAPASPACSNDADGFACTSPVGHFENRSWCGAFDMAGNVWQWCGDFYARNYYARSPAVDPAGPTQGDECELVSGGPIMQAHVMRGGSFLDSPDMCRSSARLGVPSAHRSINTGFRIVMQPK